MSRKKLFTACPSGLFRATFQTADIEEIVSRKRGTTYLRLTVRFGLGEGPFVHEDGEWLSTGNGHSDRFIAIWQELDQSESGKPVLSPNVWFASNINSERGNNLAEKMRSHFRKVKWVVVKHTDGKPSKVNGLAYQDDPPDPDWVAELIGRNT